MTDIKNSTESVKNKFEVSPKILVKDRRDGRKKLESQVIETHV